MQKLGWIALGAAPLLVAATVSGSNLPNGASDNTILTVAGEGYATSQSDYLTINAVAQNFSKYASRAVRDNAQTLDRFRKTLRAAGVADRDISTANFQFAAGHDPKDRDGERDQGYNVAHQLSVVVRNPDEAGKVLDALVEDGAENITIQNRRHYYGGQVDASSQKKARETAIKDGVAKARDYADALEMRIVRVVSVSDRGVRQTGEPAPMARVAVSAAETHIEQGESAVVASVGMEIELAPRRRKGR